MNRFAARSMLVAALLLLGASAAAQTPPPQRPAPHGSQNYVDNGYRARLRQLLRESREQKQRVVLWSMGQEIAGMVLDVGPDWVLLSNQEGQQILLQTHSVERAEIR